MTAYPLSLMLLILTSFYSHQEKQLNNVFYCFNNGVRTLPNAPVGVDAQAAFIKKIGFDGFAGHHSEEYIPRRKAMDKVGLSMPEIYWPITINDDGSVGFKKGLREIIKDSKDKNLIVALAPQSKAFMQKQEEGDQHLILALQELADYAAPYKVKLAVYPHKDFYCERLDHAIEIAKAVNQKNVGAVFNTCHLFAVEGMDGWQQKLVDAIPYLYMISINGLDEGDTQKMDWDQLIQPLGEGSFDTYQIVKLAKDNGYDGPFGLQCYNIKQDCEVALTKSMNTWRVFQKKYSSDK
jgi:sugar phosphate isomerase/epimerase